MASRVQKILMITMRWRTPFRVTFTRGFWGGVDEDDDLDEDSRKRIATVNDKLKGLIRIGCYSDAVEFWKQYRANPNHTPHSSSTYELILSIYHTVNSIEAVRQDMLRMGVVMSERCGLIYVMVLLKNGRTTEILKFVEEDLVLRGSSWFMSHIMDLLSEKGFPHLATQVADLYLPTQLIEGEGSEVLASRIRALGYLRQMDKTHQLVTEEYGDTDQLPLPVNLSLVDNLSLQDKPREALKKLSFLKSFGLRNVAYLAESVQRCSVELASEVYEKTWKTVRENMTGSHEVGVVSELKKAYLLRIFNAMMFIQAAALREEVRLDSEFYDHDFFTEMRENHIQPNEETYKAVLQCACHKEGAFKWVENTIKRLVKNGDLPSPDSMISWCREGLCLDPETVTKLVCTVRLHCHLTGVQLGIHQFKKIFTSNSGSLTVKTVKILQKMMEHSNLLESNISNLNTVLKAYQYTGNLGATFMFYQDLQNLASPNLLTFHILLDSVLLDSGHRACYSVTYRTWRMFLASKIPPDVELINKFIRCCGLTKDYTRAFFFLSTLDTYSLLPNLDTLKEMIEISRDMNDDEMMNGMQRLMHSLYPEHKNFTILS